MNTLSSSSSLLDFLRCIVPFAEIVLETAMVVFGGLLVAMAARLI